MYHDVVPEGDFGSSGFSGGDADKYKLDESVFSQHLEALTTTIESPPLNIIESREKKNSGWVLTFDDGGASALRIAKMLDEKGWCGHFFITTDFIGKPGFLRSDDIAFLAERGHVIGTHSCSHPARISSCSSDELSHEWNASCKRLSEIIGDTIVVGSVPGGYYSLRVAKAAAAAGIKNLFTSEPVTTLSEEFGCTLLGRYSIYRGHSPKLAAALVRGNWLPKTKQFVQWNLKKAVKLLAGTGYITARQAVLRKKSGIQRS